MIPLGQVIKCFTYQGGPIRGKWRILDGKEGEWYDLIFRVPRW
jgi:hypothetical protein